ncbi:hypothetical protein [Parvularcula dongshanensis]|uniref:Uncharacterized protein n=1 Tax=Parvularcula dongshanensis TaxID=1173995 RepID=A0A840I1T8_9PROT|nr:hypothetical protein [Parvularcula dongshanensis]MBB4658204.1 hypothetical protein [Parvularcula dongshanensis]
MITHKCDITEAVVRFRSLLGSEQSIAILQQAESDADAIGSLLQGGVDKFPQIQNAQLGFWIGLSQQGRRVIFDPTLYSHLLAFKFIENFLHFCSKNKDSLTITKLITGYIGQVKIGNGRATSMELDFYKNVSSKYFVYPDDLLSSDEQASVVDFSIHHPRATILAELKSLDVKASSAYKRISLLLSHVESGLLRENIDRNGSAVIVVTYNGDLNLSDERLGHVAKRFVKGISAEETDLTVDNIRFRVFEEVEGEVGALFSDCVVSEQEVEKLIEKYSLRCGVEIGSTFMRKVSSSSNRYYLIQSAPKKRFIKRVKNEIEDVRRKFLNPSACNLLIIELRRVEAGEIYTSREGARSGNRYSEREICTASAAEMAFRSTSRIDGVAFCSDYTAIDECGKVVGFDLYSRDPFRYLRPAKLHNQSVFYLRRESKYLEIAQSMFRERVIVI